MDKNTFEMADPIVDEIAEALGTLLESSETTALRNLLSKLNTTLGSRYEASLVVNVEVVRPRAGTKSAVAPNGTFGVQQG